MKTYTLRKVTAGRRIITADVNVNAGVIEGALNKLPGDNIQPNTIPGTRIKTGSMRGSEAFRVGAIDSSKLAIGAFEETQIGAGAVTSDALANLSVTTAKIALAAVGLAQLAAGIGRVKVGTYTGNGSGPNAVDFGVGGLTPIFVLISKDTGGQPAALRMSSMTNTARVDAGTIMTDGILSLDSRGFTVGSNSRVNTNGDTYCYLATGTTE